jgi:hypothetical protein
MKKFALAALVVYTAAPVLVAVFLTNHQSHRNLFGALTMNEQTTMPGVSGMYRGRHAGEVTFGDETEGKFVNVTINGRPETTFAGKLAFEDDTHSWESVCADVSSPIFPGESFGGKFQSSIRRGGNYAKAGKIVAKYFNEAKTPEQCAGLQLAVWSAIENGSKKADFSSGRFTAEADPVTMAYATKYYSAINYSPATCDTHGTIAPEKRKDNANLLSAGPGGQSQLSPAPQQPQAKTSASVS